jgi:hypothetical protein
MRVRITLSDGREMTTGSRLRYACFRLTAQGGIPTKHSSKAEDVVKHAKDSYNRYGFKNIAVDTVKAEIIASYPHMDGKGNVVELDDL